MRLSPPDLASVQHICRNLRERDRIEIEASALDPEPDALANQLIAAWRYCGVFGQVVGTDEPIGVLTLFRMSPRTASAGFVATDRWREVVKPFSRHVKYTVIPKLVREGLRRAEARAWEHHTDSRRWLVWLGFSEECRIPQWGKNGETFIQYGIVPDVHRIIEAGAASNDLSSAEASVGHRHLVSSPS